MTDTTNLGLPFIEASQAQKHVTHNEALRILDAVIQVAVQDVTRTAPPPSPVEGQRHIVANSPTDAWTGRAKAIATWQDGAWAFLVPKNGWCAWSITESGLLVFDGTVWRDLRGLALDNMTRLGVNTTALAPNLLSVKSNAALFAAINVADSGSGDMRVQLSKESAAKTASVYFSDGFSGRAEFGLVGDDDFRLKVSANGTSWVDAMRIDRTTGKVAFPVNGGPRELLAANRIYYVRTDGNDGNGGLANTAGGAFLTINKAVDTVAAIDTSIYDVIIQVADGVYPTPVVLKTIVGAGSVTLQGNVTTPANVIVSTIGATAIVGDNIVGRWIVKSLKVQAVTLGGGIVANGPTTTITVSGVELGSVVNNQLHAGGGAILTVDQSYAITGGGQRHLFAVTGGFISILGAGLTATLSGTPAFTVVFAAASRLGIIGAGATVLTFSGAAIGTRYSVDSNAVITTAGSGANYFAGNVAGSAATGGQYI